MTFGKLRICLGSKHEKNQLELYRFCNKLNTRVVGGASKLLKYAIKYDFAGIDTIITYALRDWSSGGLYEALGFTKVGVTEPNYFYTNNRIKIGRFSARKSIIAETEEEKGMTEEDIMKTKGFYRCYDSGNIKYTLKINKL